MYYIAFLFGNISLPLLSRCSLTAPGFFTSGTIFYITMKLFPVPGMGEFDDIDYYGAFSAKEAAKLGVVQSKLSDASLEGIEGVEQARELSAGEKGPKTELIVADGAY